MQRVLGAVDDPKLGERSVDLDKTHGNFIGNAVTFLSEIREEDFNAPRALWEKVFDEDAKKRWIENVSGHMSNCRKEEIIKRQIAIFREVSEDMASRLEKATGVKGKPTFRHPTMEFSRADINIRLQRHL